MIVEINDTGGKPLFEVRPDTGGGCWSVWRWQAAKHPHATTAWRRLPAYPKTLQDALLLVTQQHAIKDSQRIELKETAAAITAMIEGFSVSVTR